MSFEQRTKHIFSVIKEPLVHSWQATPYQVDEICEAYVSLWSSTSSEERARTIYNTLLVLAKSDNRPYPLDWLYSEILFEAFVASTGDRKWAAYTDWENGGCHSHEKAMYLYKERLAREI